MSTDEFSPKQLAQFRLIVREEIRGEVAGQLEQKIPLYLQPMEDRIVREIRKENVEDVDLVVSEQLTQKRIVTNHERRLRKLETAVKV